MRDRLYDLEQRIRALEAQQRAPARPRLDDTLADRVVLTGTSIVEGRAVIIGTDGELYHWSEAAGYPDSAGTAIGIAEKVIGTKVRVALHGAKIHVPGAGWTAGNWYGPPNGSDEASASTPGVLQSTGSGACPVALFALNDATALVWVVNHPSSISNRDFYLSAYNTPGHARVIRMSGPEADNSPGGITLKCRVDSTTGLASDLADGVNDQAEVWSWPWCQTNEDGERMAGWTANIPHPSVADSYQWSLFNGRAVRVGNSSVSDSLAEGPYIVTSWQDVLSWDYDGADITVTGSGAWTIEDLTVTGTITASVAWSDITGKPATFPPDSHTHPPSQVVSLTLDNLLIGNGSNVGSGLAAPAGAMRSLNWDGANVGWTDKWGYSAASGYLEAGDDIVVRSSSGILLSGGSAGGGLNTAASGQGFGIMYSSTRAVAWRFDGTRVSLADGVIGSGFDGVIDYTPSATASSRKLEVKCDIIAGTTSQGQLFRVYYGTAGKYVEVEDSTGVVTIKGASGDIVIDPSIISTAGKAMSLREIDVCDAGVAKKQLILASAPY